MGFPSEGRREEEMTSTGPNGNEKWGIVAKLGLAFFVLVAAYLFGTGLITIIQFFIWAFGRLPR